MKYGFMLTPAQHAQEADILLNGVAVGSESIPPSEATMLAIAHALTALAIEKTSDEEQTTYIEEKTVA